MNFCRYPQPWSLTVCPQSSSDHEPKIREPPPSIPKLLQAPKPGEDLSQATAVRRGRKAGEESQGLAGGRRALGSVGDAGRNRSLELPPYHGNFPRCKGCRAVSIFCPRLSFSSSPLAAITCPRQLPPSPAPRAGPGCTTWPWAVSTPLCSAC